VVPEGYRFTDAKGARIELEQLKASVPGNLLGILEPVTGGWCVLVQYADVGYVSDVEKDRLNPDEMLQKSWDRIQKQNPARMNAGLPAITAVNWELKPTYDATRHQLEWAFANETQPEKTVRHTLRLFGRHGVLDLTTIRSAKTFGELAPLKEWAKGISFGDSEGYASYEPGDRASSIGLGDLVLNDVVAKDTAESAATSKGAGLKQQMAWVIGGAICVLALGGIFFLKRRGARAMSRQEPAEVEAPASEPVFRSEVGTPPPAKPVSRPKPVQPMFAKPVTNGHANGSRRKKMFDYNRYFTDLMSAVSTNGNQGETFPTNGHSLDNGRFPGLPEHAESVVKNGSNGHDANQEVLVHQRLLIEEQKRLIQEQSRLIEEKSRLIAEKNEVLKMQSEMIESKLIDTKLL
jgi:hypothetical protein